MPKLELCVSVRVEGRPSVLQGRAITVPVPVKWRDDADVLYQILMSLDTGKDRFRDRRAAVRAVTRQLSPIVKRASSVDSECEDKAVGEIEVSEETLRFLGKLFADPPDGVELRGITVPTALLIEEAVDALKKKEGEPKGDSPEPKP